MCTKRGTQFHYFYAPAIICPSGASPETLFCGPPLLQSRLFAQEPAFEF